MIFITKRKSLKLFITVVGFYICNIQRYIVTDVYLDMTPESSFPTSEYDTYATYFSDKYSIHVTQKNQPMIKVKSLGVSKINYLVPR